MDKPVTGYYRSNDFKHQFSKGIYFYCTSPTSPEKTHYPHNPVCLAEGCRELGIPVYSNVTNWQISVNNKEHLFTHNPDIQPSDCSVVVLDQGWIDVDKKPLPADLFQAGRNYLTVYIDLSDGAITSSWKPEFRQFDYILKTHMLEGYQYPANFHPWFFGISNRMVAYLQDALDSRQRKRNFLITFRNTLNQHSLRKWMYQVLTDQMATTLEIDEWSDDFGLSQISNESMDIDNDALYWKQTGRRHNPYYYLALKGSLTSACFGGFFSLPFFKNHATKTGVLSKRLLSKWTVPTSTIVQWDSWRLWESFAAGCVSIHADFDQYHFALPVKPENWKHYIGVNCNHPKTTVERMLDKPDMLHTIAEQGQKWAIEHYSPLPTTIRFLTLLQQASLVNRAA
jgi:hypothetical protein